ncbi:MAG: antitoxin component YwqK of YwqJK toxin-antitoxin module [Bradymonadia bacterium]|jgi:antitoxin component YwqK of YwqJK toxin-antitoxin module
MMRAFIHSIALAAVTLGSASALGAPPDVPPEPIATKPDCAAAKGRWVVKGRLRGCLIRGKRQGIWSVWDEVPGAEPVQRGQAALVDGQLHGPSTDYHANGQIGAEGSYTSGNKTGPWRGFHPGGQPQYEVEYDPEGEKHGAEMFWYPNCVQAIDGAWDHGKKTGHWVNRLPSNDKQDEGDWINDTRTGTWTFWHKKGPKLESGPYVDGLRHGTWTEFTFQGHQWRTVEYDKGQRQTPTAKACDVMGGEYDVDFEQREDGCAIEGRRVGLWSGYRANAGLEWTAQYKDGRMDGTRVDLHPDGAVLRAGEYAAGAPIGTHVFKSADGKVEFGSSTLTDGTGSWTEYWPTGALRLRGAWLKGDKHGVWESWRANGNPDEAREWKLGRWDGETRAWFATGELKHRGQYRDGRRTEKWTAFFTNGRVAWEGLYDKKGDRADIWKNGFWEGGPRAEGIYAKDERDGQWIEWHNNGKKKGVGPYKEGKRDGEWTEWWYSGEPWRTVHYTGGISSDPAETDCKSLRGAWRVDPEQRVVGCNVCRVANDDEGKSAIELIEQGEWRWWHPNGELEAAGEYTRGQKSGTWERFFDDGRPMMKGSWRADVKHGDWQGYYRSGNLRFSGAYADGKEDGEWTTFQSTGAVQAKGSYKAGEKSGPWAWFIGDATKSQAGSFLNGQEDGVWTTWHANGQKKSEGRFEAGARIGEWQWWRADGTPWRSAKYEKGAEVR